MKTAVYVSLFLFLCVGSCPGAVTHLIPSPGGTPPHGSYSYDIEGTTLVRVRQYLHISENEGGYVKPTGDYTIPNVVSGYVKHTYDDDFDYVSCPVVAVGRGPQGIYFDELTSVTVSEGITGLDYAFTGCNKLKSANLPSTLRTMDQAFYGCTALQSIVIPDKVFFMGSQSFYGCTHLKSVTMPSEITKIGNETFRDCSNLVKITLPASCTSMGSSVFKGCAALERVDLGGCGNIGTSAFHCCENLVAVNSISAVTNVASLAFSGCSALESIALPDGVKAIGDNAFDGCAKLRGMTFPKDLLHIGSRAFNDCSQLTEAIFPNGLLDIGAEAFRHCSKIKKVYIPGSVQNVGQYAISGLKPLDLSEAALWSMDYSSLTNLVILDGMTEFGKYRTTSGIETLKRVELAPSVAKINERALYGCTNLSEIIIRGKIESVGNTAFYGCRSMSEIPDFGSSVTNWGTEVFSGCTGFTKVVVPSSMKDIPSKMFYNCSGIQELIIEEGVESTKNDSFLYDYNIRSLNLPSTLTNIANVTVNTCPLVSEVVTCHQATPPVYLAKAFLKDFSGTLYYTPNHREAWEAYLSEKGLSACGKSWDEATESDPGEVEVGGVPVSYGWLAKYGLTAKQTPEQAAAAKTGKRDCESHDLFVWQDYVAGTDPTDATSQFSAAIAFDENGIPKVEFDPKFANPDEAAKRLYKTWGTTVIKDGKWVEVPAGHEADYNFFKVTVEMK